MAPRSVFRPALAVIILVTAALLPSESLAQALEPRSYANVPIDLNFLLVGAAYSDGGIPADPTTPLEDGKVEVQTGLLSYARSFGILGRAGSARIFIPYSHLSGSGSFAGEPRSRTVSGLGDALVRFTWNFSGAPALKVKDYGSFRQDTILGASLLVQVPTGDYDPSKLLNIGTNRWAIKPELGLSKALGKWIVEGAAAVTFFTDNEDFYGGKYKEQEPMYSAQAHVIHTFRRGMWGALDATYYGGGKLTIDGDELDNRLNNWRVGATIALPVDRRNSVKIYASTGAYTRLDSDFDLIGIGWQYRWGESL